MKQVGHEELETPLSMIKLDKVHTAYHSAKQTDPIPQGQQPVHHHNCSGYHLLTFPDLQMPS